jgi:hypothetical protein
MITVEQPTPEQMKGMTLVEIQQKWGQAMAIKEQIRRELHPVMEIFPGSELEIKLKRTPQQNKAFHKGCRLLAAALADAGLDAKKTLKPEVDIPWTPEMVKDLLYKPILKAMYGKESTSDMETEEVSEVWKVLNRHLAEKFGVQVPFPSEEEHDDY